MPGSFTTWEETTLPACPKVVLHVLPSSPVGEVPHEAPPARTASVHARGVLHLAVVSHTLVSAAQLSMVHNAITSMAVQPLVVHSAIIASAVQLIMVRNAITPRPSCSL